MFKRGTGSITSDRFECHDVESEELSLLEVIGFTFVKHPADVGRGITGIAGAGSGLVDMRMVGVFIVRVVGGTLLGDGRYTGLSQ